MIFELHEPGMFLFLFLFFPHEFESLNMSFYSTYIFFALGGQAGYSCACLACTGSISEPVGVASDQRQVVHT
jgi:hypothetical protein